jgi:hypothetical protein
MADPILLYSVNTWLAYLIAQRYYKGNHFVWCTPCFDPRMLPNNDVTVPPTSTPLQIYRNLYEEVRRRDRHSLKINSNRNSILKGARVNRTKGVITLKEEREIGLIVKSAELGDFRPLLYVVPFALVSTLIKKVPIKDRAHPLSEEYQIESLPRHCFDVIEFDI